MIPDADELKRIVKEIQEVQREACSEWEISFLDTVSSRLKNEQKIYFGQWSKLEEIYKKV